MSGVRCGGDTLLAGNETNNMVAFHQPLHPLVVHHPATPTQLGAHPWRTIGPIRVRPDGPDLVHQHILGQLRRAPSPVAACGRSTQTGTPPPPNRQASRGTLRPPQHRRSDTASFVRLPHPEGHSSSFRVHAPVRSLAFSRSSSRRRSRSPDVSPSRSPRLVSS